MFKVHDPVKLASNELAEARRELLKAQTGLEYVQAMVAYHTARIARLENFVAEAQQNSLKGPL